MGQALHINNGLVSQIGSNVLNLETLDRTSAGNLALGGANATTLSLGVHADTTTINLGTGAGATKTITIGAGPATTTISLNGNVTVQGTELVVGDSTFQGNIQLGDATSDTVMFVGRVGSDIHFEEGGAWTIGIPGDSADAHLTLQAGSQTAGAGGNLLLRPGTGTVQGSIVFGASTGAVTDSSYQILADTIAADANKAGLRYNAVDNKWQLKITSGSWLDIASGSVLPVGSDYQILRYDAGTTAWVATDNLILPAGGNRNIGVRPSAAGAGHSITVQAGAGGLGTSGGDLILISGPATAAGLGQSTGSVELRTVDTTSGSVNSGIIEIRTGNVSGTGTAGSIDIVTGALSGAAAGTSGMISIMGSDDSTTPGSVGGGVLVRGGGSVNGTGGGVLVRGGSVTTAGVGGRLRLFGGAGAGGSLGGNVEIASWSGANVILYADGSPGGFVQLGSAGEGATRYRLHGNTGNRLWSDGDATIVMYEEENHVIKVAEAVTTADGGSLSLFAGDAAAAMLGTGGNASIGGGAGPSGGGGVLLQGGNATTSGIGGAVQISSGTSVGANGANLSLTAGAAGGGVFRGGDIIIQGGESTSTIGGHIRLQPGYDVNVGAGNEGRIIYGPATPVASASAYEILANTDALNAQKAGLRYNHSTGFWQYKVHGALATWENFGTGGVPDGTINNQILQWNHPGTAWEASNNLTLPAGAVARTIGIATGNDAVMLQILGQEGLSGNAAGGEILIAGGTPFGTGACGHVRVIGGESPGASAVGNVYVSGGTSDGGAVIGHVLLATETAGNVYMGGSASSYAIPLNGIQFVGSSRVLQAIGTGAINLDTTDSRLQINAAAVTHHANMTAANFAILFNGEDATALHTHGGAGDLDLTGEVGVVANDLVYVSNVGPGARASLAQANGAATARAVGVYVATNKVRQTRDAVVAFAEATVGAPGDPVWLSAGTAGRATLAAPTTSGQYQTFIGYLRTAVAALVATVILQPARPIAL